MMDEKIWLKALYDEKQSALHALAFKLTRNGELGKEIVSDAFLKVWNLRETLIRGGQDVGGYLYTCVRHACIDHLRKQARNPVAAMDLDGLTDIETWVDLQSISTEVIMALHTTMKKLSRQQHEVIRKLYIEEKHKTVVAAEMKISVKTLEVHRDRGLKKLKEALQKINLKNWRNL